MLHDGYNLVSNNLALYCIAHDDWNVTGACSVPQTSPLVTVYLYIQVVKAGGGGVFAVGIGEK